MIQQAGVQVQRICLAEQAFVRKRVQKLDREKRVAGCLLVYHLRQWRGALRFAANRIRNQLTEMFTRERRVLFGDQRGATIELIDDLEDRLLAANASSSSASSPPAIKLVCVLPPGLEPRLSLLLFGPVQGASDQQCIERAHDLPSVGVRPG